LPDLDGAGKVGVRVAGRLAARARSPVLGVDLPQANVETATGVLVYGVGISSTLVAHDELALPLVPARVFGAPGGNVLAIRTGSTGAAAAVIAWAVPTTRVPVCDVGVTLHEQLGLRDLDVHNNAAQRGSSFVSHCDLDFSLRARRSNLRNIVVEVGFPSRLGRKRAMDTQLSAYVQL